MMAELPSNLLILLAVITVLGSVMGYCVALILTKRKARIAIESALSELEKGRRAADPDLQADRDEVARLYTQVHGVSSISEASARREKALEAHSRQQAERIHSLEAEVTSLEDKQLRLRRDFASYKTNKRRELELARKTDGQRAAKAPLPTLSRKIDSGFGLLRADVSQSGSDQGDADSLMGQNDVLGNPLSREIDIPALAESELPDSIDELDFDMRGEPGSGVRERG